MKRILSLILLILISFGLFACKDEELTITISFDSGNQQLISDIIYHKGDTLVLPDEMIKEGYTFNGWYIDFGATIPFDISYVADYKETELTLYAKWTINSYDIDFETNGGSLIDSMTIAYHEQVNLPDDPVKSGYEFLGWYLDDQFENIYQQSLMPAEDIILYAKWGVLLNYFYLEDISDNSEEVKLGLSLGGVVESIGYRLIIHYTDADLMFIEIDDSLVNTINSETEGMIYINYVNVNQPLTTDTLLLTMTFTRLSVVPTTIYIEIIEVINMNETYEITIADYHFDSITLD